MGKYVWCEDIGSGFTFWSNVLKQICPEAIVESKKNNTSLRKAVDKIAEDDNDYYILLDMAIDNPDVLREVKKLNGIIQNKTNVHVINIHSFEFVLLSFNKLEQWVFAEVDELKEKRQNIIAAKNSFVDIILNGGDSINLSKLKEELEYSQDYNTEKLAAKLLYDITRNTGFETDKSSLGECFIANCCEWDNRQDDDICGLDETRLTAYDKVKTIVKESVLQDAFLTGGIINANSI